VALKRVTLGLLCGAAAAFLAAQPAAAKDGVKATLSTPIPLDAGAGTSVRIGWSLASRDEQGRSRPFLASAVFVRLLSRTGAGASTVYVSPDSDTAGSYSASVTVPDGGIRDVQIGLRGFTSGANGTHNADVVFPITNDPLPGVPGVVTPSGRNWTSWIVAVALGAALLVVAIAAFATLRPSARGVAARG
jgi:hypothetical protein